MPTLAILTNARAADQRSMIGYGDLLLEAARLSGHRVVEYRAASVFARLLPPRVQGLTRKLANNLDRFFATPLKLAGRRADIVHVVDPGNVIYLPLIRHRRSIATVHDMIPYLARDGKVPGWTPSPAGRWLMNKITKRLAQVDRIICVSHATRRDLLGYVATPEDRIRVIHNAVFQPMEPATPAACDDLRARLGLPAEAPVILHVGRNFYKNREAVLDVAAQVRAVRPDVRLVLVGALTPALEGQAARLGLAPALHVLPAVAREDMATLYTTAAVLLFPSLYEGFGLPVLEAQMCATPVVCSDAGALPEVADAGSVIADPSEIVGKVLQAIASRDCLDPAPRGQIRANERFAVSAWMDAHVALYAE